MHVVADGRGSLWQLFRASKIHRKTSVLLPPHLQNLIFIDFIKGLIAWLSKIRLGGERSFIQPQTEQSVVLGRLRDTFKLDAACAQAKRHEDLKYFGIVWIFWLAVTVALATM